MTIENMSLEKQKMLINDELCKLIEESESKYYVNYYSVQEKDPLIWRFIIKGPMGTGYENYRMHFKVSFKRFKNKKLIDFTYVLTSFYNLKFFDILQILPFSLKYDSNLSFHNNIIKYFNYLYGLFPEQNFEIWNDIEKILNNNREEYKKKRKIKTNIIINIKHKII